MSNIDETKAVDEQAPNSESANDLQIKEKVVLPERIAFVDYGDDTLEPDISVVVPIYGAAYTLDEALTSLEKQTFSNIEIICVNDCSPDDSHKIIKEHANKDKRYVRVKHDRNYGYGASMNDGIAVARGKWIAILEPDDYLFPKAYASLMQLVEYYDDDEIDVVKSPYIREVRKEGVKRGDAAEELLNCSYRRRISPATQPFDMTDESASHLLRHHPSIWSALYRRSYLNDKQIHFVEYPGAGWADNEFFYETLLQAEKILYTDSPYYVYREETDVEYEAFARSNKTLPFDRWHSMQDIIERLGIEDEHILLSHIAKGFTYLSGQLEAVGEDDEVMQQEMRKMFTRMEPSLVDKEPKINPHLRELFLEVTGSEGDLKAAKNKYMLGLVEEFGYTLKNNGIGYTLKRVRKTLRK